MFLKKLFNKPKTILIGEIYLSSSSRSSFNILIKNEPIEDEELILLCLLVYARILKVLVKKEKEELLELYGNFYRSFRNSDNQIKTIKEMLTVLDIMSMPSKFKSKKTVKLKRFENNNLYLDMGTITVDPLSSAVHTIFIYVFNNISSKKNKIHLLEAMTALSSVYKIKKFTTLDTTEYPNTIVNDVISSSGKLDYEINF